MNYRASLEIASLTAFSATLIRRRYGAPVDDVEKPRYDAITYVAYLVALTTLSSSALDPLALSRSKHLLSVAGAVGASHVGIILAALLSKKGSFCKELLPKISAVYLPLFAFQTARLATQRASRMYLASLGLTIVHLAVSLEALKKSGYWASH